MRYVLQMWKSAVGHNVSVKVAAESDDWETDPDFEVMREDFLPVWCRMYVDVNSSCFRMTCLNRSKGGGPRPLKVLVTKNPSGN